MKKTTVAFALIAGLLLAGCERQPDPVLSSTEKWYEVTEVKRPKHFRASFRDESGKQTPLLSISKHCNVWERLHVGSRWLLTEVVRQGKNGPYTELQGVKALCSKLQAM